MRSLFILFFVAMCATNLFAQKFKAEEDTTSHINFQDTVFTIPEVQIFRWKNKDDEMEYYKNISRIKAVLPYLKIAKKLHTEIYDKKESSKKKDYKHYRKDTEKEMREKFEKELRNLSINQGKVLVKLINRETGNNCYSLIKDIKNPVSAWGWQIVAKRYGYDLKEQYDPKKEWILEMAIKAVGDKYKVD